MIQDDIYPMNYERWQSRHKDPVLCGDCGEMYVRTAPVQKRCKACREKHVVEYKIAYNERKRREKQLKRLEDE